MSNHNSEIEQLIASAQRYFIQQKDLFGNMIYAEKNLNAANTRTSESAEDMSSPDEVWASAATLRGLNDEICSCLKCPLGQTRKNFVFGVGNPNADVMFVGEAPGADEDAKGEPFVGRAGQLLNKIIEAVEMKREDVYICNILKCRPPNNRDPNRSEMETCTPYLIKQIQILKPKFIICLGRISAQWLLQTNDSLTTMRSKVHDFQNAKLIVTYHPAALLRNPNWKRPAWEDMKLFKKLYDESKEAR